MPAVASSTATYLFDRDSGRARSPVLSGTSQRLLTSRRPLGKAEKPSVQSILPVRRFFALPCPPPPCQVLRRPIQGTRQASKKPPSAVPRDSAQGPPQGGMAYGTGNSDAPAQPDDGVRRVQREPGKRSDRRGPA